MNQPIDINDVEIVNALRDLIGRVNNPRPALLDVAEHLLETTKQRFGTQTAPDGSHWALNSVLSTLLYKDGDIPLTDHGNLRRDFDKTIYADGFDLYNTQQDYAAMMQFGGTKEQFPNLWGDIPARPFLGISDEDKSYILQVFRDFLD